MLWCDIHFLGVSLGVVEGVRYVSIPIGEVVDVGFGFLVDVFVALYTEVGEDETKIDVEGAGAS